MPLPAEGLWAVLEIMGHRRIAGRVTEETIAGAVMLRVDIPGPNPGEAPKATQYYGGASLFCMTPTTEEEARREANPRRWETTTYQLGAGDNGPYGDDDERNEGAEEDTLP